MLLRSNLRGKQTRYYTKRGFFFVANIMVYVIVMLQKKLIWIKIHYNTYISINNSSNNVLVYANIPGVRQRQG